MTLSEMDECDAGRDETARFATGEGSRYASPPLYVERPGGGQSILRRQCTKDYKLTPIWRELRRRGYGPKRPVVQWLGISTDEIQRMKPSRKVWASVTWPLVDAGLSRQDCLRWLTDHGYPAPRKSACIGCPFHDDRAWRAMKVDHPDEFAEAVAWDRQIRHLPRCIAEACEQGITRLHPLHPRRDDLLALTRDAHLAAELPAEPRLRCVAS